MVFIWKTFSGGEYAFLIDDLGLTWIKIEKNDQWKAESSSLVICHLGKVEKTPAYKFTHTMTNEMLFWGIWSFPKITAFLSIISVGLFELGVGSYCYTASWLKEFIRTWICLLIYRNRKGKSRLLVLVFWNCCWKHNNHRMHSS